jgi:hypothetical protein
MRPPKELKAWFELSAPGPRDRGGAPQHPRQSFLFFPFFLDASDEQDRKVVEGFRWGGQTGPLRTSRIP